MKFTKIIISLALLIFMFSSTSFAANLKSEDSLAELKEKFDLRISELNHQLLNIYKDYTGLERETKLEDFFSSEEVVNLQQDYKDEVLGKPELEQAYFDLIKAINTPAEIKEEQTYSLNSLMKSDNSKTEEIIEYEDGSFTVVTSSVKEIKKDDGLITPQAYTNGIGDYEYKWTFEIRHLLYPNTKLDLNTYYSTHQSSPHLKVYNASTSGTFSQLPIVTVASSAAVNQPNATKSTPARTSGTYTVTYAGYNGIGLASETYTTNAKFIIRSYTSNTVTISTEATNTL